MNGNLKRSAHCLAYLSWRKMNTTLNHQFPTSTRVIMRFFNDSPFVYKSFPSSRYITLRFQSDKSWAAERLNETGMDVGNDASKLTEVSKNTFDTANIPPKVGSLVDEILKLNILEVNQLVKKLQEKLNIPDEAFYMSAGPAVAGGAAGGAGEAAVAEPVQEKIAFDIKIGAVDAKSKIKIIKEVRAMTGLGLKEAKELVEKAPVVVKEGVTKDELTVLKKQLEDAGAVVEVL